MPRPADPIDDTTPLSAARLDIPARIGWLLRTHRSTGGLSLRQMSSALGEHEGAAFSASTLSRIESEGQRVPAVITGYARVLDLPEGLLRSAVGTLCQSFSYGTPPPPEPPISLERFDRAYDAVTGPHPTAGEWLEFALRHTGTSGFGVPGTVMADLAARLAHEVGRGVGPARFIRGHAIMRLLQGPYADLVAGVLREEAEDPDHQNFYDLTGCLCHHPTLETARWGCGLLRHPSIFHVRGGSFLLQGMLLVGGLSLASWTELVPDLERAWAEAADDSARREILEQVAGALPPAVQGPLADRCSMRAARPTPAVTWSRSRESVHYGWATSLAHDLCRRLDVADEPLLARLLFEAFFEPRGVRMSMAGYLLGHSAFRGVIPRALLDAVDSCPDATSRAAALRVAAFCHSGEEIPAVRQLLEGGDDADLVPAMTMTGRSGQRLPDPVLTRGLAGDALMARWTVYCLGMAGDPRLADVAADPTLPPQTRRAAAWWQERGDRILV